MEGFILQYGVFALALILFIDDAGIPFLPASTIVFSSAILASQSPEIDILSILLITIIIPPLGNGILFYFGKHGARHWLKTHGHKIFLPNKRIKQAERFFQKYGDKTVFIAAMMTSVRAVSSVIAGSLDMHPVKFFTYHFLGVLVWACSVVGVGYFWGDEIWYILQTHWKIIFPLVGILLLLKLYPKK